MRKQSVRVTTEPQKVLLTGGSGLVGSRVAELLQKKYIVAAPGRGELEIIKKDQVFEYVEKFYPDVIIHTAAFTDATKAEKERGSTDRACWQVNVVGTKYLNEAAKRIGAYFIFISTGSVFAGTKDNPGPFTEDNEPPKDPSRLSWYGWTKNRAEQFVDGAIIRISHPVKKEGPGVERDYIYNLLNLYQKGSLYALFTDQFFPITWIDDVAKTIDLLITKRSQGVYHVASPDLVSPYELMRYITSKGLGSRPGLVPTALSEFLQNAKNPLRFTQFCAIDSRKTQKLLRIRFLSWKAMVDRTRNHL